MANDHSSLNRLELESKLTRLKEELEDMEETTSFYFANSAAHINGGEVMRDEEVLTALKSDIAEIEGFLRSSEA